MEGELFSRSPFSMHSKVPQMEAFRAFHSLPQLSRDVLTGCWAGRSSVTCWGPAMSPPHWPLQRLSKWGCQTLLQTAKKGANLPPDEWRSEISQRKYKSNALVYPVKDPKPREQSKTAPARDAVYYLRDI